MWPFGSRWQARLSQLYINTNFAQNVRLRKCDPLGPVERPDFHDYILLEILLKKVQRRKCDPMGPVDIPDFHDYILMEILLKKVCH